VGLFQLGIVELVPTLSGACGAEGAGREGLLRAIASTRAGGT